MSAWMAGLGAGLQSLSSSAMQLLAQEQARREREEERKRVEQDKKDALARANLTYDQNIAQFAFQNNLTPYDAVEAPIARAEQLGSTFQSLRGAELPGGMGMALAGTGDALSQLARTSRAELGKGRTLDLADSSGKTRTYYQPYERTKEGMEAGTRARNKQALLGAGFSDEEATRLSNAEPEMFKVLLDRLRPQTTPQRVVGPDGTVSFVTPPANMAPGSTYQVPGVKAHVSVPGQAPYNWSVQTDDSTGEMMLVDPRTGQSRPVMTPTGEPARNVPEAAKKGQIALDNLQASLDNAKAVVSKYGVTMMPGAAKKELDAAFADLQLMYKEAANLGALAGPDMGLLVRALGDPTSVSALLAGGTEGVLKSLDQAGGALSSRRENFAKAYGLPAAPRAAGGNASGQLTAPEQAIYDAAKREGKSDAEILAFIQKMRGGR